ncbi:hypothetical protein ACIBG4_25350 [Nonomuraea sp. NPDC050383]|uniref:hypothetical protein n=1 Tax=Nonomuraea sp. NPDC050383 TaxID=3364362 RepID=UPI00379973D4
MTMTIRRRPHGGAALTTAAGLLPAFAGDAPPDLFEIGGWTVAGHARRGRIAPIIPQAMGVPDEKALVAKDDRCAVDSPSCQGERIGPVTAVPPLVPMFALQRYHVAGLTLGGVQE